MLNTILIIILVLNIFSINYWFLIHKKILNIGTFFNILSILYFVVGIYIYNNIQSNYYEKELKTISEYAIYAVIGFNSGYYLNYLNSRTKNYLNLEKLKFPSDGLMNTILLIAISTQVYMVLKIGFINFLLMDRTERFNYFYQNIYLLYIGTFIYLIYVIYSIKYLYYDDKKYKRNFYFLFLYLLTWGLLTISRNDLLIIFLTIMFLLEKKGAISSLKIIVYGISFLVVLFIFKGIMYEYVLDSNTQEGINYGEIINWIRNSILILQNNNLNYEHFSYFITIKGIISPIVNSSEPLSNWFMQTFYPFAYANGNKYGFSGVIEGYMMGGVHITFLHFFITGILLSYFSFNKSWIHIFLTITSILILYKIFRSESYNFYRHLFWYGVYPILLIKFISLILTKSNNK